MKIVYELPPNIVEIKKVLAPPPGAVFTYGDTMYAPMLSGAEPPENLLVHEMVHERQQKYPAAWWSRYLEEPTFRLTQELEAYGAQWAFINKAENLSRKFKDRFLDSISFDLSGPMYGSMLSQAQARSKIRNAAKIL